MAVLLLNSAAAAALPRTVSRRTLRSANRRSAASMPALAAPARQVDATSLRSRVPSTRQRPVLARLLDNLQQHAARALRVDPGELVVGRADQLQAVSLHKLRSRFDVARRQGEVMHRAAAAGGVPGVEARQATIAGLGRDRHDLAAITADRDVQYPRPAFVH